MNRFKMLDTCLYLRKSQADRQAEREAAARGEEYDTLARHRTELLALAKRDEHNVIDIYEEVVSGDMIANRPEMQRMLDNIKNMKYDAILVIDYDRLGRGDKVDQGRIERALKESATIIITPNEVIDLNEESGEFSAEVRGFIARMEYKQIKKRLAAGKKRSAREGKDIGTRPPFGYVKGQDLRLVIDEDKAKYIRLIFQWTIEGMGRVSIADRLTEMGVPNPSGGIGWNHITIRKILDNQKYIGHQVFGKVKWTKKEDGSYTTKKLNDPSLMTIAENAHEPIIDQDTWDRAQRAIKARLRAPVKSNLEQVNPFATILRCKKCGKAMLANNPSNRPSIYLFCDSHNRCGQKMITMKKVEEVLLHRLEMMVNELKNNRRYQDKSKRDSELVVDIAEKRVEKIKEELTKTHRRKENLHDLLEDGTYTKEVFLDRMRTVQERIKELESELTESEEKAVAEKERLNQTVNVIPNIEKAVKAYRKAKTAKEKNRILKSFIKHIVYNREKDWNGPYQFEIEIELI